LVDFSNHTVLLILFISEYYNRIIFLAREAGLLARLRHPNIVSLYKVIDTGTTVVLLLELITGGELFHWTPSGEMEAAHVVRKYIIISDKYPGYNFYSCSFQGAPSFNGT